MVKILGDASSLNRATAAAKESVNKDVASMEKNVQGLKLSFSKTAAVIGGVGVAVGGIVAAAKSAQALKEQIVSAIDVSAQLDKMDMAIKSIEGSSLKAQQSLEQISNFAFSTPMSLKETAASFLELRQNGLEPTKETLEAIGNVSAATGKNMSEVAQAVTNSIPGSHKALATFGIQASKIGEDIKYTWTNSSGEARQAIVANNSAILQSTLTSIFSSKHSEAMNMQALEWNVLLGNMQENWKITKKNIMNEGLFDYMKAIVKVVGEHLNKAFGEASKGAGAFSRYAIDTVKSTITSLGSIYDVVESIGDLLKGLGSVFMLGIGTPVGYLVNLVAYVERGFVGMINRVIDGINYIRRGISKLPGVNLPEMGHISYSGNGALQNYTKQYNEGMMQLAKQAQKSWGNLLDTGHGSSFASNFLKDIDKAYKAIQKAPEIKTPKVDFGDAIEDVKKATKNRQKEELVKYTPTISDENIKNLYSDLDKLLKEQLDSANKSLEESAKTVQNATKNIQETSKNTFGKISNGETFTVNIPKPPTIQVEQAAKEVEKVAKAIKTIKQPAVKVTKNMNKMKDTASKLGKTLVNATKQMQSFTFKFKDSFLQTLQNNQNSLKDIFKTNSQMATLNYQDAYELVKTAQQKLIQNPLDVKIGEQYQSAYNAFVSASDTYLSDQGKFATQADYLFASATIGTQTRQLQSTAKSAYSVLDNMKDLLSAINKAMEDGVLTTEEKATIAGVADRVNTSNTKLIGTGGLVKAVNSQTYYDINGAKQKGLIDTIGAIKSREYYNNTGLAKDTSLIGTNSVADYINSLNGNGRGITLDRVTSSVGTLAVNTGLDVSQIADIKQNTTNIDSATTAAKNATDQAKVAIDGVKDNTWATTQAVKSLVIKRVTTVQRDTRVMDGTVVGSTSTSTYEYYAKGGFTKAIGNRDKTGLRVAGYVHEGEWVAPPWMLKKHPTVFKELEDMRVSRYAKGGFTSSQNSLHVKEKNSPIDKKILNELIQLNRLLRNVTENGDAMRTK